MVLSLGEFEGHAAHSPLISVANAQPFLLEHRLVGRAAGRRDVGTRRGRAHHMGANKSRNFRSSGHGNHPSVGVRLANGPHRKYPEKLLGETQYEEHRLCMGNECRHSLGSRPGSE